MMHLGNGDMENSVQFISWSPVYFLYSVRALNQQRPFVWESRICWAAARVTRCRRLRVSNLAQHRSFELRRVEFRVDLRLTRNCSTVNIASERECSLGMQLHGPQWLGSQQTAGVYKGRVRTDGRCRSVKVWKVNETICWNYKYQTRYRVYWHSSKLNHHYTISSFSAVLCHMKNSIWDIFIIDSM